MNLNQIDALYNLNEQLKGVNGYLMWVDPDGGHHRVREIAATPRNRGDKSYYVVTAHTRIYLHKCKPSEFRSVVPINLGQ